MLRDFFHRPPRRPTSTWAGQAAFGAVLVAGGVLGYLAGPRVGGLLLSSLAVAVPAALVALLLGALIALLITRSHAPGRRLALVLVAAMTLAPLTVVASGWLATFGEGGWAPQLMRAGPPSAGWLRGYGGAALLHAVAATPLVVVLSVAAFRAIDRRLEEQSLLDGSRGAVLWRVTLPLAGNALAAAGVLVAVLTAGEIAITDLLRVRTFAEEIYTQAAAGQGIASNFQAQFRIGCGVAMLGMMAAGAMAVFLQQVSTEATGRIESGHPELLQPRFRSLVILLALIGPLLVVPIGSSILSAGVETQETQEGFQRVWNAGKAARTVTVAPWQHRRELRVSLALGFAVATGSLLVGALLAATAQQTRWSGWLVTIILAVLMATPGPLIAVALIRLLNQPSDSSLGWLGDLYGTWFAPWLAQLVRFAPVATLLVWVASRSVPRELLDAARSDGASFLQRLFRIAMPLCTGGLLASWLVLFALSLGELSATVLVVPPGTPPLPVRMLSLLHYGVEDRVAGISLALFAGYVALSLVVLRLLPRGGRLG